MVPGPYGLSHAMRAMLLTFDGHHGDDWVPAAKAGTEGTQVQRPVPSGCSPRPAPTLAGLFFPVLVHTFPSGELGAYDPQTPPACPGKTRGLGWVVDPRFYLALARSSLSWGRTATRIITRANQSDVSWLGWRSFEPKWR